MTVDYMGDVETLQAIARRLSKDPRCSVPNEYIEAAIQELWDVHDPEGAADRIREKGHLSTVQCKDCGTVMTGTLQCGQCAGSEDSWWTHKEAKA